MMPNQGLGVRPEDISQIPQVEIAGVPTSSINEGERVITFTTYVIKALRLTPH